MNIDKELITRKISLIQDDLEKLSELAKFDFEEIVSDFVKQAALERILERIIIRAIDINQHIISNYSAEIKTSPSSFKETFDYLAKIGILPVEFAENISKSIGLRNKLVHEYEDIDEKTVYNSLKDCLIDYKKYCDYILSFIDKEEE